MKKNTIDLLAALSSGPVQQFIHKHQHSDVHDLVLKNKAIFSVPAASLSEQIGMRRKAKEKLPLYFETAGIVYPPAENFEQCSSQATAVYKSEVLKSLAVGARSCADLTGGFGVDTFFLSRKVDKMHYVEPKLPLLEVAQHNHRLLGASNILYLNTSAEDFLTSDAHPIDMVYMDPSRRKNGQKVKGLTASSPDVLTLLDTIFKRSRFLMLKGSPLFDIQAGISQLTGVKEVHVVSVDNECKELLFFCQRDSTETPAVVAVNIIEGKRTDSFRFTFSGEQNETVSFASPDKYLYEPNASIMKAGAFKTVASSFGLQKIAPSTHLYTAASVVRNFPGRVFEVIQLVKPESAVLKDCFPNGKANISTRNYPLSPEALRKKTGLADGGDNYLLAFSGVDKKYVVAARRIF